MLVRSPAVLWEGWCGALTDPVGCHHDACRGAGGKSGKPPSNINLNRTLRKPRRSRRNCPKYHKIHSTVSFAGFCREEDLPTVSGWRINVVRNSRSSGHQELQQAFCSDEKRKHELKRLKMENGPLALHVFLSVVGIARMGA